MEQVRHERGQFIHVLRPADLSFISDHMGPDGFAAVGFFVGDLYKEEHPLEAARHQNDDELFLGFKGLAEDQSWLEDLLNFHPVSGMPKKTFTFGWSHSVKLAQDAGCGPFRGETKDGGWDHVCVVTWRSSKSGGTTLSSPGYRFSQEHHDKGRLHRPSVADIKAYLREEAGKQPPEYHGGEL